MEFFDFLPEFLVGTMGSSYLPYRSEIAFPLEITFGCFGFEGADICDSEIEEAVILQIALFFSNGNYCVCTIQLASRSL